MTRKRAIDLVAGDVCRGPRIFADQGTVQSTVVIDYGVQVNWVGGSMSVRSEDYEFYVDPDAMPEEPPQFLGKP